MANDIAVSMYLNNKQYMQSMNASQGALLIYNKQVGLSQKTMQHFEQTMHRSSNALRINQSAMSNAIFMVEDMSSVYGTSGLAGAIRAGSNNLTMMLAPLGAWAMAAGVATTAALQLYMAFNKDAEGAKNAKDKVDEYKDALDEQAGRIDRLTRLRRQLNRADDSRETGGLRDQVQDDIASIDAQIAAFEKQKKAANERRQELLNQGQMFEQAAGDNPYSSAAQAANNAFDAAKEQQQQIAELEKRRQQLIDERAQKEQEAAMIAQRHNQLVQQEVIKANQEQIAAVEEQIRKDQELTQSKLNNQKQIANAKQKDTGRTDRRNEFQQRPNDPSGARMGDKSFAESMARARQGGFEGIDISQLSKRDQASYAAMQRKADNLTQGNFRDNFADRRDKAGNELWNQMHDKGFQPQRNQELTMMARSGSLASMEKERLARENRDSELAKEWQELRKSQREAVKKQNELVAATNELTNELRSRNASNSGGAMVQLGGLSP